MRGVASSVIIFISIFIVYIIINVKYNNRNRDQLYKYGRYTIGRKGKVHHVSKFRYTTEYEFYYLGKQYNIKVDGIKTERVLYIHFDTTNPWLCKDVGSVPKCLLGIEVPAEGWSRPPYDPCDKKTILIIKLRR